MSRDTKIKIMIGVAIIMTLFLLWATFASAVEGGKTAEELLKTPGLSDTERNAIAKAISKGGQSSLPTNIKGMLEWREMGDAFAQTIKNVCQTLNVEVNSFLTSDVGKLTAAVIIYKMVGKDILRIILYTGIWLGITLVLGFSIKFLHLKKMVKVIAQDPHDDSKKIVTKTPVDRFGWADEAVKTVSLIAHLIVWFVFSCFIAGNVI